MSESELVARRNAVERGDNIEFIGGDIESGRAVDCDRPEEANCERGTVGCCIAHRFDRGGCESW